MSLTEHHLFTGHYPDCLGRPDVQAVRISVGSPKYMSDLPAAKDRDDS